MENNKSQFYSKKAIIACIGLISILILCGFVLSILICKNPISWYVVEYINCNSNILVQTYQKGETLNLPDNPERVGYKFLGWSLDESGKTLIPSDDNVVVNSGFTLYAQWQEFEFVLQYNDSNILTFSDSIRFESYETHLSIYSDNNRLYIIDNPTKIGYTFDGWKVRVLEDTYNINDFVFDRTLLENLSLIPIWQRNTCSVEIYTENALIDTINVYYGEAISLPSLTRDGYILSGFVDAENKIIDSSYIITADTKIFTQWEEIKHNVSFTGGNGAYIIKCGNEYFSGNKDLEVDYRGDIAFSVTLSKAYDNSNILVYAESESGIVYPQYIDGQYAFIDIKEDLNVVISNIYINTYNITVDGKDYGSIAYGSWLWVDNNVIYVKDTMGRCILSVMPLINDNMFGGWELICGNILVHNYIQDLAKNGEIEIIGKYSKDVARITLIANGGELLKTEIIYDSTANMELPEPKKTGFEFVGWFVKLVEVNLVVDESLSVGFTGVTGINMVLYAGWRLK